MSSSTVPAINAGVVANNNASMSSDSNHRANPRRRAVVVVEKNVYTERIPERGVNDRALDNGHDLSHTIRGESVIEKSKDLSQLKKGLITPPTVSPLRKKPLPKPDKPKWQKVLSILTKNIILLAFLLWSGQMIWKWSERIQYDSNTPFAALDYEGRVSEVEASLKKMAKMFQVQLTVLDKKFESEVGTMTKKLHKEIEEKGVIFEMELKNLEAKTDVLDKSLGELKDRGPLSVEEFERFWNELKNKRSLDGSDTSLSLDQIRAIARDLVEKEIENHAADGLGRIDYALASGGAKVIRHSRPYGFGKPASWSAAFKGQPVVHANAQKMLEPSFGEPGQCFALEGSQVDVLVKLRTTIIPEAVTLEHVAESVAYDRSSAPKEGKVVGWFEENTDDPSKSPNYYLLAKIYYDLEKSNVQTFIVEPGITGPINMVHLFIDSNHGSSTLTCIYRFRVHGYEPSSPAA